jgi:hypothetical protein
MIANVDPTTIDIRTVEIPTIDWKAVLEAAKLELNEWDKSRTTAEEWLEEAYRRIEVLQTTIYNIHLLAGEKFETAESAGLFVNDVVEHIGFSETVMNVLEAADGPLSVPEIKQRLEEGGRDLRKYTNVRSTIHTVARRLVISGRVREVFRDGRRFEAVRSDEAAVTEKPEPQPKSPVHRKKVSTLARGRAGSPK